MKNSTIWESASKPLFVKSVLLEAGHHHFILDYETKQKFHFNSNLQNNHDAMYDSVHCNLGIDEELHLVGSSKFQYEQNFSQQNSEKTSNQTFHRLSRNLKIDHFKRQCNFLREEAPSERGSLYDISSILSTTSHSDEKLAERVLNWLDLAGKTSSVRPVYENRGENFRKKNKKDLVSQKMQPQSVYSKKNDSVRHVTIIFNKEGVPIKLNRPIRNIDLCTISSNGKTTRHLCGNSASATLCKENNATDDGRGFYSPEILKPRPKTTCFRRNLNSGAIGNKHKPITERENFSICESKRQVHIFMPSLLRKTVLNDDNLCTELKSICRINSL